MHAQNAFLCLLRHSLEERQHSLDRMRLHTRKRPSYNRKGGKRVSNPRKDNQLTPRSIHNPCKQPHLSGHYCSMQLCEKDKTMARYHVLK